MHRYLKAYWGCGVITLNFDSAALPHGNHRPVPTGLEGQWAPETELTRWRKKNSGFC